MRHNFVCSFTTFGKQTFAMATILETKLKLESIEDFLIVQQR